MNEIQERRFSNAWAIIGELRRRGFLVLLTPGDGISLNPSHSLTEQIVADVREYRIEIVETLRAERQFMSDPQGLLILCQILGITLTIQDDQLTVEPDDAVYPELANAIEGHLQGLVEELHRDRGGSPFSARKRKGWRSEAISRQDAFRESMKGQAND